MDHNPMDSDDNRATTMVLQGDKHLQNCDKPYFHDQEYPKNNKPIGRNLRFYHNFGVFNHHPNPIENVLRGSIDHTETLWTLNITSILLVSSGDLILTSKNRFITTLDVFVGGSLHKVAWIGLGIIGLRFVCTKYIIFLMSHTRHVSSSNPTIGWANRPY